MYHACITLCHTSDWDFSNIYMIFLLSMYLNYKGLVWYGSEHPGVPFSDIRVWGVVTSGCRKPEDGGVSEHFCLLSALFLLVFCKKVSYVDEITFLQCILKCFLPCLKQYRLSVSMSGRVIQVWHRSDTWIRHVSLLLLLFINAYEAKCDRVIENLGKTIKRNRPFLVVFNILRSESTAII